MKRFLFLLSTLTIVASERTRYSKDQLADKIRAWRAIDGNEGVRLTMETDYEALKSGNNIGDTVVGYDCGLKRDGITGKPVDEVIPSEYVNRFKTKKTLYRTRSGEFKATENTHKAGDLDNEQLKRKKRDRKTNCLPKSRQRKPQEFDGTAKVRRKVKGQGEGGHPLLKFQSKKSNPFKIREVSDAEERESLALDKHMVSRNALSKPIRIEFADDDDVIDIDVMVADEWAQQDKKKCMIVLQQSAAHVYDDLNRDTEVGNFQRHACRTRWEGNECYCRFQIKTTKSSSTGRRLLIVDDSKVFLIAAVNCQHTYKDVCTRDADGTAVYGNSCTQGTRVIDKALCETERSTTSDSKRNAFFQTLTSDGTGSGVNLGDKQFSNETATNTCLRFCGNKPKRIVCGTNDQEYDNECKARCNGFGYEDMPNEACTCPVVRCAALQCRYGVVFPDIIDPNTGCKKFPCGVCKDEDNDVGCTYDTWTTFTQCVKPCGPEKKTRTRNADQYPNVCTDTKQTRDCGNPKCTDTCVGLETCRSYYDGCNYCTRSEISALPKCTLRQCIRRGKCKCLDGYDPDPDPTVCPPEYDPVCAKNGTSRTTYRNKCMANKQTIVHKGPCPTSSRDDPDPTCPQMCRRSSDCDSNVCFKGCCIKKGHDDYDTLTTKGGLCVKAQRHVCKCTSEPECACDDESERGFCCFKPCGTCADLCSVVEVRDTLPPVITLLEDDALYYASKKENYVDMGATCHDEVDGSLSHAVEVSGDVVNMRRVGTYTIRYNCKDEAGNRAKEQTRTITIRECPNRRKLCSDGETWVTMVVDTSKPMNSRGLHDSIHCLVGGTMCRAKNKCVFEECPLTKEEICADGTTTYGCSGDSSKPCPDDVKKCSDGTYVNRDPAHQCQFKRCSRMCCKAMTAQCLACSQDVTVEEYCRDHPRTVGCQPKMCTRDAKRCPDGSFVGRDPYNNCKWHDCPKKNDGEDKPPGNTTGYGCPEVNGTHTYIDFRDDRCTKQKERTIAPVQRDARFVESYDEDDCTPLIDADCYHTCTEKYQQTKNAQWMVQKCRDKCKRKTRDVEDLPRFEYKTSYGNITGVTVLSTSTLRGGTLAEETTKRMSGARRLTDHIPVFDDFTGERRADLLPDKKVIRRNTNVEEDEVEFTQIDIKRLVTNLRQVYRLNLCYRRITLQFSFWNSRSILIYLPRICRHCYSKEKGPDRNQAALGSFTQAPPGGGERYLIALHGETRNNCGGRSCECYDGALTCDPYACLKRREYNMLSTDSKGYDEKQLLIDAFHWIHDHCTDNPSNPECGTYEGTSASWGFKQSIADHLWYSGHAHGQSKFLPWHRQYMLEIEEKMQVFHKCVNLPYWDWTKEFTDGTLRGEHIFESEYFGQLDGDQSQPTPVPTGVNLGQFQSTTPTYSDYYEVPDGTYHNQWAGQDLDRNGGSSSSFASEAEIANLLTVGSYASFRSMLEGGPHVPPHTKIGGEMGNYRSPGDPLFWLHHAFVDKIWYDWQYQNGGANLYAYDSATTANLSPQWDRPVSDMFDSINDLKICYQDELVPLLGDLPITKWDIWRRIMVPTPAPAPDRRRLSSQDDVCQVMGCAVTLASEDRAYLDMMGMSSKKAQQTWCLLGRRNATGTARRLSAHQPIFHAAVQEALDTVKEEYQCSSVATDYNTAKTENDQTCCENPTGRIVRSSLVDWFKPE